MSGPVVVQGHQVRQLRHSLFAIDEPTGDGHFALTIALAASKKEIPEQLALHRPHCQYPEVFDEIQ